MLVYKYRGGSNEIFKRDLEAIEKNYFWSSNYESLNDPLETTINSDGFFKQSNSLLWFLNKKQKDNLSSVNNAFDDFLTRCNNVGIYSLSKSYLDELLWAHYADSHKGFCIEYDLDLLTNNYVLEKNYSFPVIYSSELPQINFNDLRLRSEELIQKKLGCKSKRWEYEKEHRIITDNFGTHNYDYNAVKSIYFGLKMDELHKIEIKKRLKGRKIKYYQIIKVEKAYGFKAILLEDNNNSEDTYMKQISEEITNSTLVNYNILEKYYNKSTGKADIKIEIESPISENVIKKLAKLFSEHLFQNADRTYIFYYLKSQDKYMIAWATSHILDGEIKVNIDDYPLK